MITALLVILGSALAVVAQSFLRVADERTQRGLAESIAQREVKVLIIVTDGSDNDSPGHIKKLVRDAFPNSYCDLILISVGSAGSTKEFSPVVDETVHIDDFEGLARALVLAFEAAGI